MMEVKVLATLVCIYVFKYLMDFSSDYAEIQTELYRRALSDDNSDVIFK
jgi:hypothetical protein